MGWNWNDPDCGFDGVRLVGSSHPQQFDCVPADSTHPETDVLIVEDSDEDRLLMETSLRARGVPAQSVASALDALDLIAEDDRPRVLLIDWMMPDFDGLCLVEALQRHRAIQHTYCIMTTGRGEQVSVRRAYSAGVDDYLVKPLDFDVLHRAVIEAQQRVSCDHFRRGTGVENAVAALLMSTPNPHRNRRQDLYVPRWETG